MGLSALGVDIYSAYKSSTYATLNGTSMVAPHVTETVSLPLSYQSKVDVNNDGKCTSEAIKSRLKRTAIDLGQVGKDNIYASELIDIQCSYSISLI
ncbi:S8 family serine peptidase [Clostridium sp. JNZ J1-5]